MVTLWSSHSLLHYSYKLPGPRNVHSEPPPPRSISLIWRGADQAHREGRQISLGSWEDLDMVLARLLFSPLQTGRQQDGQWLHPESDLLQRQEIVRFLGRVSVGLGQSLLWGLLWPWEDQVNTPPPHLPWDYPTRSWVSLGSFQTHQSGTLLFSNLQGTNEYMNPQSDRVACLSRILWE